MNNNVIKGEIILNTVLDASDAENTASKISDSFNSLKLSDTFASKLDKTIETLYDDINEYRRLAEKPIKSQSDLNEQEKILKKINKDLTEVDNLKGQIKRNPLKFVDDKSADKIKKINKVIEDVDEALKRQNIEAKKDELSKSYQKNIDKIKELKKQQQDLEKIRKKSDANSKLKGLEKQKSKVETRLSTNLTKQANTKGGSPQLTPQIDADLATYERLEEDIKKARLEYESFDSAIDISKDKVAEANREYSNLGKEISKIEKNSSELKDELDNFEVNIQADSLDKLRKMYQELYGTAPDVNMGIEELKQSLNNFSTEKLESVNKIVNSISNGVEELGQNTNKAKKEVEDTGDVLEDLTNRDKEITDLGQKLLSFFAIDNTIQLFRDAVKSAFETVKELDSVMTEAAVVTDYSISDMWGMLPKYTTEANKLGVAVKDLYGANTLYLQQGLDINKSMQVGIETMKMARIANMEASAATDMMTSALRGFNMELNETSAQRVNDVYSKLAAVTASDTQELGTAMSKTASIAASANMKFETTAAFLAQIIETTREPAETAGTALRISA